MARVSPGVGEMEVNHHTHTEPVGTTGLYNNIIDVVPAFSRVYPYAQPDGVDAAVVAEQLHALHFLTVCPWCIEFLALVLKFGDPAHVGAVSESSFFFHYGSFLLAGTGYRAILCASCRHHGRGYGYCR